MEHRKGREVFLMDKFRLNMTAMSPECYLRHYTNHESVFTIFKRNTQALHHSVPWARTVPEKTVAKRVAERRNRAIVTVVVFY
jgi:hypothetical protein